MNKRLSALFMRLALSYVKWKDRLGLGGVDMDKPNHKWPLYLTIIIVTVLMTAGYEFGMKMKNMPKMAGKEGLRVIYRHNEEADVPDNYRILLTASSPAGFPPDGVTVYYLTREKLLEKKDNLQQSDFTPLVMTPTAHGNYFINTLPHRQKAQKYYFFISVKDNKNLAVTLPENPLVNKDFFRVTYKSDPNLWGLAAHVLLMIMTLFFLVHTLYFVINYLANKKEWSIKAGFSTVFWGMVVFFISGFPLGMWIAYEKYGVAWGGVPFGWDITDNKTQIAFLYWLSVMILAKAVLFKRGEGGYKAFAYLSLFGIALTTVIFTVIPHSL